MHLGAESLGELAGDFMTIHWEVDTSVDFDGFFSMDSDDFLQMVKGLKVPWLEAFLDEFQKEKQAGKAWQRSMGEYRDTSAECLFL